MRAMFCPQCRAEYRPGFHRCADCDVELVSELPQEALDTVESVPPGDPSEDPFCSFWQGDDPRLHAEICQILDEQGIAHTTVRRADHLFNLSNYAAFQIGVPASQFERAESAIKDAYDSPPEDLDPAQALAVPGRLPQAAPRFKRLPPMLAPAASENLPGPPSEGILSEWHADDANAEIWRGDDAYLANVLVAALHENHIRVATKAADGRQVLAVFPSDEPRAREIAQEIVEGRPPE